jgi:hypothetical protein
MDGYRVVTILTGDERGAIGSPVVSRAQALADFGATVDRTRREIALGRRRIVVLSSERFDHLIGTSTLTEVFQ